MSVVNSFLTVHKQRLNLQPRELAHFAVGLAREALLIERENTGSPGKAAIEYLLDTKYQIVENRYLEITLRDQLLDEVDALIKKFVVKYHIKKKGNTFIFDESLAIASVGDDLLSQLYDLNTKLEVNKIQLTRTTPGSSQAMNLTLQIKDIEQQIKDVKVAITKQKYFSHCDDQNSYNPLYRRSLGEKEEMSAKKAVATGTALGAVGKATHDVNKFKKKTEFKKTQKEFQAAAKDLTAKRRAVTGAFNDYDIASAIKKAEQGNAKQFHKFQSNPAYKKYIKDGKVDTKPWKEAADKARSALEGKNGAAARYKRGLNLIKQKQVGVNKALLKGSAKGALLGAAAGLAAYGIHKHNQNKKNKLKESLDKHINKLKETN